ncbi:prenyltransferase/squalene oxidase repeat-containing protein [Halorubellus litoreus]|uniref:Prenyltransferase/squalene oxidase repeat-containing protein n=1 Tax=Halorubellus litoreus TaxID=755308 RepID=A0ABD5VK50_9EURY
MHYAPRIPRRAFLGGVATTIPNVDVATFEGEGTDDDTTADGGPTGSVDVSDGDVADAIEASHEYLFSNRRGTNQLGGRTFRHWETHILGLNENGKYRQTLYYAILLEHLDRREDVKERCISFLLDAREDGGGWGDVTTNYGALLLFDLADDSRYDDVVADIEAENEREGFEFAPTVSDGDDVDTGLTYDMRVMYAALSDAYSYEELFPLDAPLEIGRLMAYTEAFDGDTISATGQSFRQSFVAAICAHFLIASEKKRSLSERDRKLRPLLKRVLISRRLSSGVWATSMVSVLAILALRETGVSPAGEDAVRYPVDWIARNRVTDAGRVEIWNLPTWDTAKVIDALLASGLDTDDERVREAAQWLYNARVPEHAAKPINAKLDRPMATYRNHQGDGWGYRENIYSDWDTTSMCMEALAPFMAPQMGADAEFLLDVQNSDGSWSTFAKDFDPLDDAVEDAVRDRLHPAVFRRFFGRNRATDVTGGALSALGKLGYTVGNSQAVRDAVSWLEDARSDNGMWVAIWGQAFTYGTARVLRGFREVGVDMDRDVVQDAVSVLREKQNDDGGWGEESSYAAEQDDPMDVPYEPDESTPEQTAWALQALFAAGVSPNSDAVQHGVNYLLETQRDDGSWPVSLVMYNWGGPKYSTAATTQGTALKALGSFRSAQ